jgi:hypothetical protein
MNKTSMDETTKNPFDKEPAEGSRETVDKQLEEQERPADRLPDKPHSGEQRHGKQDG